MLVALCLVLSGILCDVARAVEIWSLTLANTETLTDESHWVVVIQMLCTLPTANPYLFRQVRMV